MWRLEKPSDEELNTYKLQQLDGLFERLNPFGIKKEECEKLLVSEPKDLEKLNADLMKKVLSSEGLTYDDNTLRLLKDIRSKRLAERSEHEKKLVAVFKKLSDAVGYKEHLSKRQSRAYWLTNIKRASVCPYCNREYTFTVEDKEYRKRMNDEHRYARPALDHWFPESYYPLLALSFYNLIPSCTICNSSVKGDTIFSLETHIHPYVHENDDHKKDARTANPKFSFSYKKGLDDTWDIDFENLTDEKEKRMVEEFRLKDLYRMHYQQELGDLINLARYNNKHYIKDLLHYVMTNKEAPTVDEAYRMLFGTEYDVENQDRRPLSKVKHDLIEKILHEADNDN